MQGDYDLGLVVMSILTAIAASFAALNLAARVALPNQNARRWLVTGAIAMGAGIWSMHFIGMLAFSLPVPLAYDRTLTIASLLIAIVTSGIALAVVAQLALMNDDEVDIPVLLAGAIIMGAGISGMHYTGMAAMKMAPAIEYRPWLFAASMLIAVSASAAALWLAFMLRSNAGARVHAVRAAAAVVMGFAIAGMHYTAMAAAIFAPGAICTATSSLSFASANMGYGLSGLMLLFLGVAIFAAKTDVRT